MKQALVESAEYNIGKWECSLPVIAVKFYKNEMIQGEAQHDIYKPADL